MCIILQVSAHMKDRNCTHIGRRTVLCVRKLHSLLAWHIYCAHARCHSASLLNRGKPMYMCIGRRTVQCVLSQKASQLTAIRTYPLLHIRRKATLIDGRIVLRIQETSTGHMHTYRSFTAHQLQGCIRTGECTVLCFKESTTACRTVTAYTIMHNTDATHLSQDCIMSDECTVLCVDESWTVHMNM